MLKKSILNLLSYGIEKARCHHIKLFYMSLYCMLLVGCGKQVKNSAESEEIRRDSLTSSNIVLEDEFSSGSISSKSTITLNSTFEFHQDSAVRIPASVAVTSGNAGNNTAVIYFNAQNEDDYGFYCKYIGGATSNSPVTQTDFTNGLFYHFHSCYTLPNDLGEVNYYPGREVIQFQENSVILELLSADPRYFTKAQAQLEVDWH